MSIRMEYAKTVMEKDPAAFSLFMSYVFHPGVIALTRHQRAHKLWLKGWKKWALWLSYRTRKKTGIEIHPGAQIGRHVLIDHGMGVVIGETAIVEDDVTIYHGTTLGGREIVKGKKRHPTIKRGAMIGVGAMVLGDITVGEGAKIGANSVVLQDVDPGATAVGIQAHVLQNKKTDEETGAA